MTTERRSKAFPPDSFRSSSQAIGVAAYNEGFEGVIYPRPLNPKCRNLAIFSDRITSGNIQLLELRTPGFTSRACEG